MSRTGALGTLQKENPGSKDSGILGRGVCDVSRDLKPLLGIIRVHNWIVKQALLSEVLMKFL